MKARAALLLLGLGCAERGESPAPPGPAPLAPPRATLGLGVSHTCALTSGRVACWGYGGQGQLGDGTRADRHPPTLVPGLDGVAAIAAGTWHTCALRQGGEVLCWGDGTSGQLGDGALGTSPRPVRVAGVRAVAIAAGFTHTCALDPAGAVLCWGSNLRGESGAGEDPRTRPAAVAGLPPAAAIAAGESFTCALVGGDVWCWGADPLGDLRPGPPTKVPGIAGAVTIAAGGHHACAGLRDARLLCWGTGREGQLGDGREPDYQSPASPHAPPSLRPRLAEVALPPAPPDSPSPPVPALGAEFACALRAGGAWCWGAGRDGQLGDGGSDPRDVPVQLPGLADLVELAAGSAHACARRADGELRCWGYNESGQVAPPAAIPRDPIPAVSVPTAARVVVGDAHACAWSDAGAWCWGEGAYGQLGDGARVRRELPVAVAGLPAPRELVAGERHTCALDRRGDVHCWGDDTFGQLGGPDAPHGEPRDAHGRPAPLPPIDTRSRPRPAAVPDLHAVLDLAVHGHTTCALREDGGVTCWHARGPDALTPEQRIPGAVELALGAAHTCARLRDGGVRCWGTNHTGRLGDGTTASRDEPVAVRGLDDAVALVAGRLHTCAVRRRGDVVCWGDGFRGQLGDGAAVQRPTPVPVADLGGVRALAAGEDSTCAIGQAGALRCWGANDDGQLGDGTFGTRLVPVAAGDLPARDLALGPRSACALREGGRVDCWGAPLGPRGPKLWDTVRAPRPVRLPPGT